MTQKPLLSLLIGPMGSGKSSIAKRIKGNHPDAVIISQDEMGKEPHLKAFYAALAANVPIIVDRCNFDKKQRDVYSIPAREAGYEIEFLYLYEKYEVCFKRLMEREGHPTIDKGDAKTARECLDFYFKSENLENIEKECDRFVYGNVFNGKRNIKMIDISFRMKNFQRVIIISDPHGCYAEIMALLMKLNYNPAYDILIIAGDLNDRGPESHKVIQFALSTPNVYTIRGNHDNKLLRHLRGNKVHVDSLKETLEQLGDMSQAQKDALYMKMMDFPYIIKAGDNYISHAGFNPNVHPEETSTEFCMYARYFDPNYGTFTRDAKAGFWFNKKRKHPEYGLFFGHHVVEKFEIYQDNIYPLDGGMCFGEKVRACILVDGKFSEMVEIDSSRPKRVKDDEWDHMNKFEPYDKLVEMGYLRKSEKGPLVLYNYTEKCTFDAHWNKYTIESRGLILNKDTGDTVARPFPKFFNLGELENKQLPQPPIGEEFVVEEKLDGSLGICYFDPVENKYKIATRGSFESDQAIIGTEMLQTAIDKMQPEAYKFFTSMTVQFTLLFEIIYPENRKNDGARLVVDYGDDRTLVLLAAIDRDNGRDCHYLTLNGVSQALGFPLRKEYKYSLEELVELKKSWPVNFEGVVVRYIPSNFRMKVKGDEYCKMQKILNSISPLSIWEKMQDDEEFILTDEYLLMIPEEIRPEVEDLEARLHDKYEQFMDDTYKHFTVFLIKHPAVEDRTAKNLGLYVQDLNKQNPDFRPYASGMFLIYNNLTDRLHKHAIKCIRPKANKLEEL